MAEGRKIKGAVMKRSYILGLLLTWAAWAAQAEVLWWATDSAADIKVTYEGTTETTTAAKLGATDVRIRYADSTDYLPFAYEDGTGGFITADGETVTPIPVQDLWTDIGTDGAGRSFVVELGNWNGSEWTSRASATAAYSSLREHIGVPELGLPAHTPWNVTGFTAVPEPTSGLLTLLGAALLALKRKKQI